MKRGHTAYTKFHKKVKALPERIDIKPEDKKVLVDILKELCKLSLTDYDGVGIQKPQHSLLPYKGSPKYRSTEGKGDVTLRILFAGMELKFIAPNHDKNLEVMETFAKTVCIPHYSRLRGIRSKYRGNNVFITLDLQKESIR